MADCGNFFLTAKSIINSIKPATEAATRPRVKKPSYFPAFLINKATEETGKNLMVKKLNKPMAPIKIKISHNTFCSLTVSFPFNALHK